MAVPQSIKEELEKRGELILALEMLTVDQACRLLALEAVLASIPAANRVKAADVKAYIDEQSKRYRKHFEGQSLSGFSARAERIAAELTASPKAPSKTAPKTKSKPKKAAAKKSAKKPAKRAKPAKPAKK